MEDLYLEIINNVRDGIYFVDANRTILFWNRAAEEITGYTSEEIVGLQCAQTKLDHIDEEGRPLCSIGCPLFATIIDGKHRQERVFLRHKQGYRIPILVNIFPVVRDGEITGAIEIFTQDSPTVYEDKLVEQLSDIAMHDSLTGLPNRRYLESYLNYKMDEYHRFGRKFAVIFADIDDFRGFNNAFGHDTGDKVLANIASSLKRNTRKDDLIGRWGGEEFVGVYPIANTYDAPIIAEKLRRMIECTEVTNDSGRLHVTLSIGVTAIQEGDTIQSMLERADKLMYQAKRAGKNRIVSG